MRRICYDNTKDGVIITVKWYRLFDKKVTASYCRREDYSKKDCKVLKVETLGYAQTEEEFKKLASTVVPN